MVFDSKEIRERLVLRNFVFFGFLAFLFFCVFFFLGGGFFGLVFCLLFVLWVLKVSFSVFSLELHLQSKEMGREMGYGRGGTIYIYICIYIYMYLCVIYIHKHICTYTYVHTYIYMYMCELMYTYKWFSLSLDPPLNEQRRHAPAPR